MADTLLLVTEKDRLDRAQSLAQQLIERVGRIILGKDQEIRLALSCLLARGHLLIEDVPGVGKTLLARALAAALGLSFRRIQFTSDMLPADIIGVSIFDQAKSAFNFHKGPLFAHLVLADEVNRATPKAQSALLEAMGEHQITADGETYRLPEPFFVIATQNPIHQVGTFPLPESQLDRFLMRIGLGYPDEPQERELLRGNDRRHAVANLEPVIRDGRFTELQATAELVHVSDAILDYMQALVRYTRRSAEFALGLSPRSALDLVAAARCWAMINGHPGVHPEDVQAVFPAVAGHRLRAIDDTTWVDRDMARHVLESVDIP